MANVDLINARPDDVQKQLKAQEQSSEQPSPEQIARYIQVIQAQAELMDLFRRKMGKQFINGIDRYMKARCKKFNLNGPYTAGDIFRFFAAVTSTVLAHLAEQISQDSRWDEGKATDLRALFDGLMDDFLEKQLNSPMLTTKAVMARIEEMNEALAEAGANADEGEGQPEEGDEGDEPEDFTEPEADKEV